LKSPNHSYLPGVDHLRAAAAVLVLFYHGLHLLSFMPRAPGGDYRKLWVYSKNPFIALIEEGHSGVALFMVLSGFILSFGAIGRTIEYRPFLRNRLLRIYPLLLVMLAAGIAANPARYSLLGVIQSLLFQANLPGALSADPFSSMFWTVGVEFQFYLIFPFIHEFLDCEGVRWGIAMIALCNLLRLAAALVGSSNPQEIYYWQIVGRLDQFLLGMLAARVYARYKDVRLPWGWYSLAAGVAVLAMLTGFNQLGGWNSVGRWKCAWPTIEGLVWAAAITSYVAYAKHLPALVSKPLALVGTISYSMYLLNVSVFSVASQLFAYRLGAHPNRQSQVFVAEVVLPILLAVSALSYYVVERPFLRLRVNYLSTRASSPR
jgi:peptidoglycan/LPS O-acetylase OafA/YrhL